MNRRGTTLVELVVALLLGGVIAGLVAQSLVAQRRAERVIARSAGAASAVDEAMGVLTAALARVAGTDTVLVRGDTALEWRVTLGVALACAAGGDTLVLPDGGLAAWWDSPPDSGNGVEVSDTAGSWTAHAVLAVRARDSGGACGGPQRTLRVQPLLGSGGSTLVRIVSRRRFVLYRASDGAWWLGERTCSFGVPVRCDAVQPAAGPLAPPPAGLRFALDSIQGRLLVTVTANAGRVTRSIVLAPSR